MNTTITSKQQILQASRTLISQRGWQSINIRSVAKECNVSVGSIYNYFTSKSELITETIESIWQDIFYSNQPSSIYTIEEYIAWIYQRMSYANTTYPGFFALHSMAFDNTEKTEGIRRMNHAWQQIPKMLCHILQQDPKISKTTFNSDFSIEDFAQMLFSFILSSMLQQNYDCSHLLQLIKRIAYQ